MDLKQAMMDLSLARGPSGREWVREESSVTAVARALLDEFTDRSWVDAHGSLIGVRENPGRPKLLLDAHLDEVSMTVTGQAEGFLRFSPLGIDPRILPATAVKVLAPEGELEGVITCLPPHVLSAEERKKPFKKDDLYIDCGLTEAEAETLTGCPVVYAAKPFLLGENRVCGKSLDDRACYLVLLRALELLKDEKLDVELYVVGSGQEENGGTGAATACYGIDPDFALVTDVTFGDTPDSPKDATYPMGGGPTISQGPILNRRLTALLKDCAKAEDVEYALEIASRGTGTNADDVQSAREGVPTVLVSIPLQYMHEPLEVIDLRDVEAAAKLIAAFVRRVGKEAAECV